jgi:hypothetical protein
VSSDVGNGRRGSDSITTDVVGDIQYHETYWWYVGILCCAAVFDCTVSPLFGCEKLYLVI